MVQPQCAAASTTAGALHLNCKEWQATLLSPALVIYLKYAVVAYAEQALLLTVNPAVHAIVAILQGACRDMLELIHSVHSVEMGPSRQAAAPRVQQQAAPRVAQALPLHLQEELHRAHVQVGRLSAIELADDVTEI